MSQSAEDRARALGIEFPSPPRALANYIPTYRTGKLLFVSGQICLDASGALVAAGRVGAEVTAEQATLAARTAAINVLAQARNALGSLDEIAHVVRLGGFIASTADYTDHPAIMNGASDLMVDIFGDAGRHTRSTIGVNALPKGATAEVEAVFELK